MKLTQLSWPDWPQVDTRTLEAVSVSLMARRWAISGSNSAFENYILQIEKLLSKAIGRRFAITTANGSSAILIALQALNIGPGDHVLLPAMTWVGCATAILRAGAVPVFADVQEVSPCIDPRYQLGLDPRTIDAILAVHLYGSQVDVDALRQRFPRAKVIEDFAHCFGAITPEGEYIGSLGDISIVSFQTTKVLTCSEGGAAFTDSPDLAADLIALRTDSQQLYQDDTYLGAVGLEPAQRRYGANYALSEIHAALLRDQLDKLPQQTAKRAEGVQVFRDLLASSSLEIIGDRAVLESGAFYGVPVWLNKVEFFTNQRAINAFLDDIERDCGLRCDTIYPPIPQSPLYRPHTMKLYAQNQSKIGMLPNTERWHRGAIVVPHYAFLASTDALRRLAQALTERVGGCISTFPVLSKDSYFKKNDYPTISIIILSHNRPKRLRRAIQSVIAQDYPGSIQMIILGDNCEHLKLNMNGFTVDNRITLTALNILGGEDWAGLATIERVSRLRNMARDLVEQQYVCFLDDDNQWEQDHLSSLIDLALTHRIPAVHSWRRLILPNGEPWHPDRFPWLSPGEQESALFSLYTEHGVLSLEDSIVRDVASLEIDGIDYGMVDLGEWLLDASLLYITRFETKYIEQEPRARVGEDDKLLKRFRELGIPTECTRRPTLLYYLGGFSNDIS